MIDINKWYTCKSESPKKKGKYLLLVGTRTKSAIHTDIGIVEAHWNGKIWEVDSEYSKIKWKYIKPGEIDSYPDYSEFLENRKLKFGGE